MKINKHWQPKEFRTGIINPSTGKEYILSNYYVDANGNKHFTHDEALEIAAKVAEKYPSWRMCDDEFHQQLAELVWDEDEWEWKENVNGTGLNGFEYMTQKLGYELGGFRYRIDGKLYGVGNRGFSYSSSVSGSGGVYLNFRVTYLNPSYAYSRAYGLQLRCLSEK